MSKTNTEALVKQEPVLELTHDGKGNDRTIARGASGRFAEKNKAAIKKNISDVVKFFEGRATDPETGKQLDKTRHEAILQKLNVAIVASVAGAILPAMMMSDQHLPHPINLRVMWSPLANSGLAGIFLGVLSGAFSISAYRIFHAGTNLQSCADRALSAVQTPLFWAGPAHGIIIGALTVTKFHSALLWNWHIS